MNEESGLLRLQYVVKQLDYLIEIQPHRTKITLALVKGGVMVIIESFPKGFPERRNSIVVPWIDIENNTTNVLFDVVKKQLASIHQPEIDRA